MHTRKLTLIPILILSLLTYGCGGQDIARGFKAGLAASPVFVDSLVASGTITRAQADLAIADITDGVNTVDRTITCLRAVTAEGPSKRIAQARCYQTASHGLRAILARHHLDSNPQLNRIALIVAGAIEAFDAFFSEVVPDPNAPVTGPINSARGEAAEKELEGKMKLLKKQLDGLK